MSDFHQRAIKDVARACGANVKEVTAFVEMSGKLPNLTAYAVAQRERVLELEAVLRYCAINPEFALNGRLPEKAKP